MKTDEPGNGGSSAVCVEGRDMIFGEKFVEPGRAAETLKRWLGEGLRPVYAFGSFELLHVECVRFAAGAASRGVRLLVGVYDDDSVARIRGGGRPVMCLKHRLDMAAALECAGAVTVVSLEGIDAFVEGISPYSEYAGVTDGPRDICSDGLIDIIREKYVSE